MNPEESTFDKMRHRPRFSMYTDLDSKEFASRLRKYLEDNPTFQGTINREVATIWVKTKESPIWKPNLSLRSETEKESGKTIIRGIFGPSSNMWTLVMFLYFILSILWMVSFTLWFVGHQLNIDDYSWCIYISFLMIILVILTYTGVRLSHKKSESEMNQLRDFVIESTLQHESTTTP